MPEVARRKNFALFRTTASDEQGGFRLTRVPPGNYRLFAWDSVVPARTRARSSSSATSPAAST